MDKYKVAVLMTCFNRKNKTLTALKQFYSQRKPDNCDFEIFLVDDGSSDGTGDAVRADFPDVHVIPGTGSLFWGGGMRLAWRTAAETAAFDFYLWLNDDTFLQEDALLQLFTDYRDGLAKHPAGGLVVTCCRDEQGNFSYGGYLGNLPVLPKGEVQPCRMITGNLTLVPRAVYEKIGILDDHFTHSIGDSSYGLTALENGFQCWVTSRYLAVCNGNPVGKWRNPAVPLRDRIRNLYSPLGLNLPEYLYFVRKHHLGNPIWIGVKIWAKLLLPGFFATPRRRAQ